jgi:hypothetical protein
MAQNERSATRDHRVFCRRAQGRVVFVDDGSQLAIIQPTLVRPVFGSRLKINRRVLQITPTASTRTTSDGVAALWLPELLAEIGAVAVV